MWYMLEHPIGRANLSQPFPGGSFFEHDSPTVVKMVACLANVVEPLTT